MVAGLPVLIEASLRALGAAACVVSITLGTRPGAVALLGGSLIAGLSVVDSYLLLARYAAVGLMRRDSVTLE
jgi:hypothetical protein